MSPPDGLRSSFGSYSLCPVSLSLSLFFFFSFFFQKDVWTPFWMWVPATPSWQPSCQMSTTDADRLEMKKGRSCDFVPDSSHCSCTWGREQSTHSVPLSGVCRRWDSASKSQNCNMHTERSLRGDSRRQGEHGSGFQAVPPSPKKLLYGAIMHTYVPPLR